MWEKFEELCRVRHVRPADVARATGVSPTTISEWKKGLYTPKQDKLLLIAEYFGVTLDYLLTGEEKVTYYDDPETEALAQKMRENPDFRLLFSAAADASPEDLKAVYEMLLILKRREVK